jgi:hypothetical protein
MRRVAVVIGAFFLFCIGLATAGTVGSIRIISGPSPYPPGCQVTAEPGTNYENAEVEPWVDVNPLDPNNMIAVWQQDRWSNGGAHALATAVTQDGGVTWTRPAPPHFSRCTGGNAANGGDYDRASDPWVTFAPNGHAYQISLSVNQFVNFATAILVSKSTDGGDTWSEPITLIRDTDPPLLQRQGDYHR